MYSDGVLFITMTLNVRISFPYTKIDPAKCIKKCHLFLSLFFAETGLLKHHIFFSNTTDQFLFMFFQSKCYTIPRKML